MRPRFYRLNQDWNAEPYTPNPEISIDGRDLLLRFTVSAAQYPEFQEGEIGLLRFVNCHCYRLGPPNDNDWYEGNCRFSRLAPEWGEFYLVVGDAALLKAPQDWQTLTSPSAVNRHYLFYFRDNTFEIIADACSIESSTSNALLRLGKKISDIPVSKLKPDRSIRKRLCRSQ